MGSTLRFKPFQTEGRHVKSTVAWDYITTTKQLQNWLKAMKAKKYFIDNANNLCYNIDHKMAGIIVLYQVEDCKKEAEDHRSFTYDIKDEMNETNKNGLG